MLGKKGWVRIVEAVFSVLIVFGVLIILYSNTPNDVNFSVYVHDLQLKILEDTSNDAVFRNYSLNYTSGEIPDYILNFIDDRLPTQFGFNVTICDLDSLNSCLWSNNLTQEVYVEEKIVSSNFQYYEPRMLRLFVWQR